MFIIVNRNDFSNLGLKHIIIIMIIIVQKKAALNRIHDVYYIYIWEIFLQHVSAKMGHYQVMHTVKYAKKNYCISSYLNLNEVSFYN